MTNFKLKEDNISYGRKFPQKFSFTPKTYKRLVKYCEINNIDMTKIKDKDYFYTTNAVKIDSVRL